MRGLTIRLDEADNPATLQTSAPGGPPLGEILLRARVITGDVLEEGLARATRERRRIGDTLVAMGAATATDVLQAVAVQQEIAFLSAEELPSTPPLVKELSPKYLRQYLACPIAVDGATITVATAEPTNPLLLDDLRQTLGMSIRLCVAPAASILEAIERAYGANTALQKIVEGMGSVADRDAPPEDDVNHLRDMAFEAPVVRLVNLLVEEALTADASDIHIEPFEDSLRVRYRIDGLLYNQEAPPRRLQAALTSRIKIMAEMNIAERRLPQDGRIRVTAPGGRRVDIRVSTVPTIHGESIVMRLLDRSSVFLPFDRLGFSPRTAAAFETLIHRPHGILLVTGPTGSGKTTTLYAALSEIKSEEDKIITIEDPVEYQLKGITQIPVNEKKGLTFARGLRSILRHDPDKIMVGEIRDAETADIAIQSALTGHLVFTTVHANNVIDVLGRFLNMKIEPYNFVSALNCVQAQRLVRTICVHCKRKVRASPELLEQSGLKPAAYDDVWFYEGAGCLECGGTGYKGRMAISELLDLSDNVRELILARRSSAEIKRAAREEGMVFLRESAVNKALAGHTTLHEINKVTFVEAH